MSTSDTVCSACGAPIDTSTDAPTYRTPCSACGGLIRTIGVSVHESVRARDGIGIKVKRAGEKRPHFESLGIPSHSTSRGKLVHRERIIDRDGDRYLERVTDYENGETIHFCEEPLSEHVGHGSDKAGPASSN